MANFTVRVTLDDYVDKNGESKVEIVATYKRKRYPRPLAIHVAPENLVDQRITGLKKASNMNAIIDAEKSRIELALLDLERKGELSPVTIKAVVNPHKSSKTDFYTFCEKQVQLMEPFRAPATLRVYRSKICKLRLFDPGPVYFSDINSEWLSRLKTWMIEKGNAGNTIWDTEKFLSSMLNAAIPEHIKENPLKKFERTPYVEGIPRFLLPAEIKALEGLVSALGECKMKRAGIYFLADMEMGLRMHDLESFDMQKDVKDGRLIKQTSKKKTIVSFKLSNKLEGYRQYIETHPLAMTQPDYDNQLKKLGRLAGIQTVLSSHVARHTLGKRLAKAKVNIAVTQRILGHKSLRSTERYYHLDNEDMDEAIDALK